MCLISYKAVDIPKEIELQCWAVVDQNNRGNPLYSKIPNEYDVWQKAYDVFEGKSRNAAMHMSVDPSRYNDPDYFGFHRFLNRPGAHRWGRLHGSEFVIPCRVRGIKGFGFGFAATEGSCVLAEYQYLTRYDFEKESGY